jgi:hypothetical protein
MDAFPHNPLTPIRGQPTPHDLLRLKKELVANARSVPSDRGGGRHGHLILVITPEEYATITNGIAFAPPINPGAPPVHDRNATNAQIHAADTTHQRLRDEFRTYIEVQNRLMKLLLAAVDEPFYSILCDPMFGYADVTPCELLAHLNATYGTITATELVRNKTTLKAPWNPDEPITTLWNRVRNCQQFAQNTIEPLTEAMIILHALEALAASGVMAPYINEWQRRDPATQTYDNFVLHFERADKVRRLELTTRQAGYHNANYTTPNPVPTSEQPTLQANATPPAPTTQASTPTYNVNVDNIISMAYCWTHGLSKNLAHNSMTCKNPGQGHHPDATIANMKGGSTTIAVRTDRRRPPNPRNT